MRELAADLLRLAEHVPKAGRLTYKLMPPEVKEEINEFLKKVLEKNADCDREFKKYIQAALTLCSYYTDKAETHDKAAKAAYEDMMTRLGNVVLRAVKQLNQQARNKDWKAKKEAYRREAIESLVVGIFGVLARAARAEENKLAYAYRTGELSKQAKKELVLKLENSNGYDWEQ